MSKTDYQKRFDGLKRLYGDDAFKLFKKLHIAVVGIGGVGSWAVESLARSGIGEITLIDYDDIAISNMNRQLHALDSSVGQKKIKHMEERIHQINPDCKINLIDDFVNMDNMRSYMSKDFNYVIDAIDSIKFKSYMIYYCKRNKIPIITTGGAGGLTDPTMIQIKDLSRTYNDALAACVRKQLRDDYNFPKNTQRYFGIECVFSSQQPVYPKEDGTVSHEKPGIHGVNLDCSLGYGASVNVTAMFGFVAVSRVIAKILKKHHA